MQTENIGFYDGRTRAMLAGFHAEMRTIAMSPSANLGNRTNSSALQQQGSEVSRDKTPLRTTTAMTGPSLKETTTRSHFTPFSLSDLVHEKLASSLHSSGPMSEIGQAVSDRRPTDPLPTSSVALQQLWSPSPRRVRDVPRAKVTKEILKNPSPAAVAPPAPPAALPTSEPLPNRTLRAVAGGNEVPSRRVLLTHSGPALPSNTFFSVKEKDPPPPPGPSRFGVGVSELAMRSNFDESPPKTQETATSPILLSTFSYSPSERRDLERENRATFRNVRTVTSSHSPSRSLSYVVTGSVPLTDTFSSISDTPRPYFAPLESQPSSSGTYSIPISSRTLTLSDPPVSNQTNPLNLREELSPPKPKRAETVAGPALETGVKLLQKQSLITPSAGESPSAMLPSETSDPRRAVATSLASGPEIETPPPRRVPTHSLTSSMKIRTPSPLGPALHTPIDDDETFNQILRDVTARKEANEQRDNALRSRHGYLSSAWNKASSSGGGESVEDVLDAILYKLALARGSSGTSSRQRADTAPSPSRFESSDFERPADVSVLSSSSFRHPQLASMKEHSLILSEAKSEIDPQRPPLIDTGDTETVKSVATEPQNVTKTLLEAEKKPSVESTKPLPVSACAPNDSDSASIEISANFQPGETQKSQPTFTDTLRSDLPMSTLERAFAMPNRNILVAPTVARQPSLVPPPLLQQLPAGVWSVTDFNRMLDHLQTTTSTTTSEIALSAHRNLSLPLSAPRISDVPTAPPSPDLNTSWSSVDDRTLKSLLSGLRNPRPPS